MGNRDTQKAFEYHERTKHSYWSIRTDIHYLDWDNQPAPFKIYGDLEPIPLPSEVPETGAATLDVVAAPLEASGTRIPDLNVLAHILYYSAGITKTKRYPGGEIYFRAAACAGALYPIEVYVVCGDLPGLEAGVYHFSPRDFALRRLRGGDFRGVLVRATAGEPVIGQAPVTLVQTAISWRSSWKYRARAYRYHFWDDGMILANALAAAAAHRMPTRVVVGFVDDEVNHLLGIDGEREMSLTLLPLGHGSPAPSPPAEVPELRLETVPLSRSEVDYPLIREMHAASRLGSVQEVKSWREGVSERREEPCGDAASPLRPLAEDEWPRESLESVIRRRGSTRRFARKAIRWEELSTILDRATRGFPADFLPASRGHLNDLYLNVHAVEGLTAGVYFYCWRERALELLREGDVRQDSQYLCLEQALGGDSSVTIFYLADLSSILGRYGNRGYRAAQLEAGIIGGKLYLSAYALGRGATGLTFYDDDVTEFFSPHAEKKSAIFVTALGVPGKRPYL